ncbi:hypothetical protein A3742_16330 [Oleiphilus sp. HI0071]|uniref:hypothetical protein n=1 Tax=unclassified Oleiphilus TaxID=2631174 RepID=UPI0007C2E5D3|nr:MULTISPECIES: hypothetical protein [unclassified Oleiphilus]KZY68950.1 hypothetical protein A3737_12760 [Oleiphilus sp. HI0065]KZY86649.1 hypothetical protein A3742_16330 [Oleiphilus sp. HI0071]KZY92598.1 hypothetical protein A3744_02560 [Oleiphilus sp. HI0073]KZZ44577.1 hypothetical protein A3758_14925 [Oleiphilus sp. HI0118]KZZ60203.1 hypothetical protein A3760_16410 [Oleiphilus sp. HI0122]KZZ63492.1 hypothetical protein A3765_22285 [Oleiphilus sp. HI0130]KZZ75746.1 hypothetical protein
MRAQFAFCTAVMATALFSSTTAAEGDVRSNYNEPTRGFYIEHGTVAKNRDASIELHSGSDSIDAGGGVRLGLPGAELIINSGLDEYDENQLLLKYGLPDLQLGGEGGSNVHWAFTGAYSRTELEDENGNDLIDQINLKLGAAFTVNADAATFTLAPRFVYADGDQRDDTFVELDLGAYVGIIDTQAGLFSAGVEALFTTADNTDDTYAAGVRWAYDSKLNIDFVPLVFSNRDLVGVPGLVRVNYNF